MPARFSLRLLARAACLLPFFLSPCPAAAPAFDPERGLPLIRTYPPETYRAHSQIFATAQADDGVLYFATYGAVVSFDGIHWKSYPIPGTWVRALTVGPDGLIYVGGAGSLGRLEPDPATGLLRFVSLAESLPAARRDYGTVWSIARMDDGVAFGLDGALLQLRGNTWREWPFPGERPALRTAGARLFYHSADAVHEWVDRRWQLRLRDPRLAEVRRVMVLPDNAGVLLALDNGVLLRLPDGAATATEWVTPAQKFLRDIGLRNAVRLADGSLAISTSGEGLLVLAPDGTPSQRLTSAEGLTHTTTYGLFLARDGSLWVETAHGVSQIDLAAAWSLFDSRNGRPIAIGGALERFRGELIAHMSDQPTLRLRPAASGFDVARFEKYPETTAARIVNFRRMGQLLISGNDRGLIRIDDGIKLIHATSSQVEDVHLSARHPGLVVIGLLRGAEIVRVAPDGTVTPLGAVPDFNSEVTNCVEDRAGSVWLGTTAGFAIRLRFDEHGALRDSTRFDATRGLPPGSGWVRPESSPEGVLLAVRSGIVHLDPATDRLVPHPAFATVHPAGVNTLPLTTDGAGRFWFQTAREGGTFQLGCLDLRAPASPRWTPLPAAINEALGYGGVRVIDVHHDGDRAILWLSGIRATIRLEVDAPVRELPPPAAMISEISQGAQRWAPRTGSTTLPFSREPLRFTFASPIAALEKIDFETRLLGYDANWTPTPAPEVAFTNLSGGPFTLEVRARDSLSRTGAVARHAFSVAPPWQRSPAAFALYAFTSLGAVVGFIRWRLGRAAREHRRLEALVATRTAELATARDAAESASRAKSAFLASMSHELRTPLNGVIGYAQVLQDDRRLLPDQRERLRIVQHSGEHLLRMINDVLDLAKIEAGKLELRPAPFALADLLRDIAAAHAPAAAAKRLAFTIDLAPDLPPWVEGDAQKLRQILDNLLGNAVKFTAAGSVVLRVSPVFVGGVPPPRGPSASTSSHPQGEGTLPTSAAFAITDTGPGIDALDQARLFQPFEQATRARPNAPGAGLGLAISRALVERLGGSLTLTSEPGRGSTFTFSVPLPAVAPDPAVISRHRRLAGYDGSPRHVLIVDDHAVNRSLLTDLLTPLGFTCIEFPSGEAALAHLQNTSLVGQALRLPSVAPWPDLAILDVRMEGLDGLALTRRLRALPRGSSLKILLTSASVLTFDPAEGRAAGCDDFLPKPFRTADLVEKIGALLALRWRHVDSAAPFSSATVASPNSSSSVPFPADLRDALREHLSHGDLDAFRAALTAARAAHPAAEPRFVELEAAAAAFELSRLRHLLESP